MSYYPPGYDEYGNKEQPQDCLSGCIIIFLYLVLVMVVPLAAYAAYWAFWFFFAAW